MCNYPNIQRIQYSNYSITEIAMFQYPNHPTIRNLGFTDRATQVVGLVWLRFQETTVSRIRVLGVSVILIENPCNRRRSNQCIGKLRLIGKPKSAIGCWELVMSRCTSYEMEVNLALQDMPIVYTTANPPPHRRGLIPLETRRLWYLE